MAGGTSPRAGSRRALVAALLCCVVMVAAHAHQKRQDMSPAPFTFAARYGRSPARRIALRDNRWMLSTRYGKRSPPFMEGYSSTPEAPLMLHERPPTIREGPRTVYEGPRTLDEGLRALYVARGAKDEEEGVSRALSCVYTGVLALYRCTRTQAASLAARKRTGPVLPSEEE